MPMSEPMDDGGEATEEFWRDYILHGDPNERAKRRIFQRLPSAPRCKTCAAPFGGIGARAMRMIGIWPSGRNPSLCNTCYDFLRDHRGGAEIEITMLFADVRGSTALAERMSAGEFRGLLQRFYHEATEAVFSHGGELDKFVGDEVVAMFMPVVCEDHHAASGVAAARKTLRATGHGRPEGPWIPVGVGVHTGPAWVGTVGDASHVELTALGDAVNVASRLASVAVAGEVVVSDVTATAAGLDVHLPRTSVELKGKELPLEVVRLREGRETLAAG